MKRMSGGTERRCERATEPWPRLAGLVEELERAERRLGHAVDVDDAKVA
jgi:hypothetical protein